MINYTTPTITIVVEGIDTYEKQKRPYYNHDNGTASNRYEHHIHADSRRISRV